jgi:hypothetical protein
MTEYLGAKNQSCPLSSAGGSGFFRLVKLLWHRFGFHVSPNFELCFVWRLLQDFQFGWFWVKKMLGRIWNVSFIVK